MAPVSSSAPRQELIRIRRHYVWTTFTCQRKLYEQELWCHLLSRDDWVPVTVALPDSFEGSASNEIQVPKSVWEYTSIPRIEVAVTTKPVATLLTTIGSTKA